ncbi:hypothetical protein FIBSPDRAFT_967135 [Athelia psychrophila]|uniref:Uncharacterized protein n=1 Tax=Athelia psychrophila TaxID=1759441 RepID=A0A167W1N6_9AGAM|nr:hypothetical protein FIBSPDRAFT_967135 [Fibularhizoctonia sp. CBS 109695]
MPQHTKIVHRIRFVGGESLGWRSNSASGTRSWTLYQQIDMEHIHVGANITILRCHPTHQDNPDSSSGSSSSSLSHPSPHPLTVLLEGKVLGIESAKRGSVIFIVKDSTAGGLTTVRVPAKATAINPKGGLTKMAKSLRKQKGPVIPYFTWLKACDLQTPAARATTVSLKCTPHQY